MTDRDDKTRERVEDPHLLHARRTYANAVEVLDQLKSGHAEIERRVEVLQGDQRQWQVNALTAWWTLTLAEREHRKARLRRRLRSR